MRVAIFGSGPAGLLIAHAAFQAKADFEVFSLTGPSVLHGAQYLHRSIPGIANVPVTSVRHRFYGTYDGYRKKVYGMDWEGAVSPEKYDGDSYAWDIRYAYDWLWREYQPYLKEQAITEKDVPEFLSRYDLVFSTIPRTVTCLDLEHHQFKSAEIYAIGSMPDRPVPVNVPRNAIICSGEPDVGWYRVSNVFGQSTVEYPARRKPPISGVVKVLKPTETTCDCWPTVHYAGRYGKWQKGVLVHHAYEEAKAALG